MSDQAESAVTGAERLARLEAERDDLVRRLGRARGALAAVLVKLDPEAGGLGCGLCLRSLRDALRETPLDDPGEED